MSCLTIVQDVCAQLGLTQPNAVVTSSDLQILQLLALLNKEGKMLAARPEQGWQVLQLEATFTTVATETQTTLAAVAPNMRYIINDTIWNRTTRRPVFGPLSPQDWQYEKGWFASGPYSQYRIQGNNINFSPVPTAGQSCYFEYVTKNWATDSTGVTGKMAFTADSDVALLDEEIMTLGLLWRWKQMKGLQYAEEFNDYESRVEKRIARDIPRKVLSLAPRYDVLPPLMVQDGNFPG